VVPPSVAAVQAGQGSRWTRALGTMASGAPAVEVPRGPWRDVSKRLGSRYVSGRCRDWLKFKNPNAPAVKREAEEDWAR
jgi:hypothetical protein